MTQDKLLHFFAGIAITALVALLCPTIATAAFFFGFAAGVAKEVYDYFTDGLFDWYDLVVTAAGALIVQVLIWGL